MRSESPKAVIALLFLLTLAGGICKAEDATQTDKTVQELEKIQTRLGNIEKQQEEILAKEDRILAELDRIRIWVHRK